jgi:hypothetical protein
VLQNSAVVRVRQRLGLVMRLEITASWGGVHGRTLVEGHCVHVNIDAV